MYAPTFWKTNKEFLIHTMGFINFWKKEVMLPHPVHFYEILPIKKGTRYKNLCFGILPKNRVGWKKRIFQIEFQLCIFPWLHDFRWWIINYPWLHDFRWWIIIYPWLHDFRWWIIIYPWLHDFRWWIIIYPWLHDLRWWIIIYPWLHDFRWWIIIYPWLHDFD